MWSSVKKFFYFSLFVVIFLLSNGQYLAISASAQELERIAATRVLLVEKLLSLDFERLANRDFNWLESLGANYDYDNQQYFIELTSDATLKDSSVLLMIDFSHKDSLEIRLFAPEELSYIWMHSRLRVTKDQLYISYVFHPQSSNSKLFKRTIQRNHRLAGFVGDYD